MCGLSFYLSALLQLVRPALHLLDGEKDIAPLHTSSFVLPYNLCYLNRCCSYC